MNLNLVSTIKAQILFLLSLALLLVSSVVAKAQSPEWQKLGKTVGALYQKGQLEEAMVVATEMLDIAEKESAPDPATIATSLNILATLYEKQGQHEKAEPLFKRALAIREKVLVPDHPNMVPYLNHLAKFYFNQDQYDKAEPLYKQVLAIREKALGPDHPELALDVNNLAVIYHTQGQYEKAEALYKRALAIREKAFGPDHPNMVTNLNNLAELFHNQGQYEKSEPLYKRVLAIREKVLGADHPDVAKSLNNLAGLYYTQGQYEKAMPIYKQVLAMREKVLGPDHPDVAMSLNSMATLYYTQGEYEKSESLYKLALAIGEKALGPDHPDVAVSLHGSALLYKSQGQYEKAESLYKRALAIREKALGPNHPDVATNLNNLAELYRNQGQYEKAEPLYKQALSSQEKALRSDYSGITATLNNLALLYYDQGQYKKAELLYKQALAIGEKALGPEHPGVAASLNNLAGLYHTQGQYEKSESLYKRALAIREKALGPNHPDVATSLNSLAGLYDTQGQYKKAESLYKMALAISEKVLGPDHPDVATSLNNLATLYTKQSHYEKAELLHRRALAILEKAVGPNHPNVASSLHNLAELYTYQDQYEKAEPLLKRALAIGEKALGPEHPGVAASLNNLAGLYHMQGQYEKAKPLLKRALAIIETSLGPNHPDMAVSLNNLAVSFWADGELIHAVDLLQRANAIREHHLRLLLAKGSEYEKRAYMATINSDIDEAISLDLAVRAQGSSSTHLALTTLLQRKGRILDALADSFGDLRRRLTPEDTALLDQLASVNGQRAQMYTRATQVQVTPEKYQLRMASLEAEAQALEARISANSAEFRTLAQPITLERVKRAIPSGVALVEFSVYRPFNPQAKTQKEKWEPERYVAYILGPEGDPVSIDLGEARSIERIVANLRKGLADPYSPYVNQMGRKLDELVMRPIRGLLGKIRTVLLSPDGALNLVPFGALVDKDEQYLLKAYAFTYLSSGRDLLRMQARIPSRYPGTLMADVDYGSPGRAIQTAQAEPVAAKRRSTDFAAGRFLPASALPGTAAEAQAIARIFPTIRVLRGKQATESALKQLDGPRILHVATHGFFLPILREEPPEEPGLQLTRASSTRAPKTENPLLRSGLVLANANQLESGGEDGVLTALEAAGLDLWGTKLVVLSACETSVGEVQNGEGVFGLRRALIIAGSESQVMSLWKVNDLATKDLMVDYYRNLLAKEGRSEALRQAQLTMLNNENRSHPYYWAGFIPSGDWTRLESQVSTSVQ